jgi:hypothetical protein
MGLNISVCRKGNFDQLPGWDWVRHSGDRDFQALVSALPATAKVEENWCAPYDFEFYVRPADFAVWREAIAAREWPNPGRFEWLMDQLEANPDFYIYFGI